jgi:tetratricopeptide (TPR) repeat protein
MRAMRYGASGTWNDGAMETAGEERVRAGISLRKLEDSAQLLASETQADPPRPPAPAFPRDIADILNSLTTISSREDAERLLAAGVSMWNSVIAFEGQDSDADEKEALVKSRHVSVDCIFMASTVLGGISANYNIDEVSLLKFYTSCGKKYASDLGDMAMAAVCFEKAEEFASSAKAVASSSNVGARALSKAMFDLLLGSAECAWDQEKSLHAEELVAQASEYLPDLPDECEYMASILFNLGLFCYQAKEPERALVWLDRSLETRGMSCNPVPDMVKQAKTMRLAGVCHLAQKQFAEALTMMEKAESTCHDPVGAYLLLKLSILTRSSDVMNRLAKTLDDPDATIDVCMGSVALLTDAQRLEEAVTGFEMLLARFASDRQAIVKVIGPRYFECLSSLGQAEKALQLVTVVEKSLSELHAIGDASDSISVCAESKNWCALLLYSGSALAERKEYQSAASILGRCLSMANSTAQMQKLENDDMAEGIGEKNDTERSNTKESDVVFENEARIRRLSASCALFAASEWKQNLDDDAEKDMKVKDLLFQAMSHALKAKALDGDNFATRLLVFRIHLMRGDSDLAAAEMKEASEDIHDFDPGELAEAACEAKDIGSFDSVLAVLRCILRAGSSAKCSSLDSQKRGFYGTVFLSAVHIAIERATASKSKDTMGTEDDNNPLGRTSMSPKNSSETFWVSETDTEDLLSILRDGCQSLCNVGLNMAFDEHVQPEPSLHYLSDIAWNTGRDAAKKKWYLSWNGLFDVCCKLSAMNEQSLDVLATRRTCNIMCASALIEQRSAGIGDESAYDAALANLADARSITTQMNASQSAKPAQKNKDSGDRSLKSLMLVLEAQCFAARSDQRGLAKVIQAANNEAVPSTDVLEQLASIAFNAIPLPSATAQEQALRLDNVVSGLSGALDAKMLEPKIDVKSCSAILRELLGVELCNLSGINRSYATLSRSIGLLKEHADDFPVDERRWLTATAWDAAQMHCKTGKVAEAVRWAKGAIQCAEGNPGSYTSTSALYIFILLLRLARPHIYLSLSCRAQVYRHTYLA